MTCKPSEFIKTHARAQRKHEKQISTIKYATKTENITSKSYVKCIFEKTYLLQCINIWTTSKMPRPDRPAVSCFTLMFHAVWQLIWAGLSWAELIWADRPRSTFRDFGDNILKTTSNVQSSTRNRPKNFPLTPDLLVSWQERARGGPCCFWACIFQKCCLYFALFS